MGRDAQKYERFEKVRQNQELNAKFKKDRIGHILTRSTKKELFREKYFKTKKLIAGDTKDKRADRLNNAMHKTQ